MKKFVLAAALAVVVGVAGAFFLFGGSAEGDVDAFVDQVAKAEAGNSQYLEIVSSTPDISGMSHEELADLEHNKLPAAIAYFEKKSYEIEALRNRIPEDISLDMARALSEYCEIAAAENATLAETGACNLRYLEEYPSSGALEESILLTEKQVRIVQSRISILKEISLMKRYE